VEPSSPTRLFGKRLESSGNRAYSKVWEFEYCRTDCRQRQLSDQLAWKPCTRVAHQGLDFSGGVYRAIGTFSAGMASLAKTSVLFKASGTIDRSCMYSTAISVGMNFHPNMAALPDPRPWCFWE
jgi:hypothetical protein